jgi:hypothetical protein
MAPKKAKAKGGGDDDDEAPTGTCNQVKVRHILCEKHGKCMEALKEITGYTKEDGTKVEPVKFNVVAQKYSEDKAKEARELRGGQRARSRRGASRRALRPASLQRSSLRRRVLRRAATWGGSGATS